MVVNHVLPYPYRIRFGQKLENNQKDFKSSQWKVVAAENIDQKNLLQLLILLGPHLFSQWPSTETILKYLKSSYVAQVFEIDHVGFFGTCAYWGFWSVSVCIQDGKEDAGKFYDKFLKGSWVGTSR